MEDKAQPPPPPPPQEQQEVELAGYKRKREDSPDKPAGDETAATSPAASAGDEAAAPAGDGRPLHPMSKTSLCSYFLRGAACSHGAACWFAHTEEELRPRPDGTWDPTSDRAKKLRKVSEEEVTFEEGSLEKCLVGLSRHWATDRLKEFLDEQASIAYSDTIS